MPTDDPLVAAVVVTWNSAPVVGTMLRSLLAQEAVGEIVIVDNASADATLPEAQAAAPDAKVIANPTNRGLAAAINQGMLATSARFLLLCNADIEIADGAVAAMLATADRHPAATFVIPRFYRKDGQPRTSVGDLPTLRSAIVGRQGARRLAAAGERAGFWWDEWDHTTETRVPRGFEACYLVRREGLLAVGPQDERFILDWEGIDWAARVNEAGGEIWFCPEASVVHVGGQSIRQVQRRWIVSSHKGMYRYFAKRRPAYAKPLLAAVFGARALAKLAVLAAGSKIYDAADDAF